MIIPGDASHLVSFGSVGPAADSRPGFVHPDAKKLTLCVSKISGQIDSAYTDKQTDPRRLGQYHDSGWDHIEVPMRPRVVLGTMYRPQDFAK